MKKNKTKFIFDLDGTLFKTIYTHERIFFEELFGKNNDLVKNVSKYLGEYEKIFKCYDDTVLSEFLSEKTGLDISVEVIRGWREIFSKENFDLYEGCEDLLFELKNNNKFVIALTNWYTDTQVKRLKLAGIYKYFDEVHGGDVAFKPNREAFINACGKTPFEECIVIGDTYEKDIVGASNLGIDSLYINGKEEIPYKRKIKTLNEIKEWI